MAKFVMCEFGTIFFYQWQTTNNECSLIIKAQNSNGDDLQGGELTKYSLYPCQRN